MIGKPEIIRIAGQMNLNPHVVEDALTTVGNGRNYLNGFCNPKKTGAVLPTPVLTNPYLYD